jgi:murein DD-endopeptidase MepM/ murein hydrolase activator NlpD
VRPTRTTAAARSRVGGVVVALLAAVLAVTALHPASAEDIDQKIADASDDVADASREVKEASRSLEAARSQLPAAQAEVAAAAKEQAAAKKIEVVAAAAAERATAAVLIAQQRVAEAEARIVEMNGQIGDLARAVYTQGPYAELAAVLDAASPSDFASRLEAVRSVSRSQNKTLAELARAKADLEIANVRAEQSRAQAEEKRRVAAEALAAAAAATRRAEAAQRKVEELIAARKEALRVAEAEKAKVLKQYEAYKREQERLRQVTTSPGGYTGTPTGNLIWPIPGAVVVQGVGPRTHPVYGYASCHTGVDIRGSYGTPILASAAGKVVEVANGGPYGLHTVISHGDGVSVMIAHQSSVAVGAGSIVTQGQVVGYVGTTGWVTGAHLHWEVHVNGVPYDPMGWFGGSRSPVSCWNS